MGNVVQAGNRMNPARQASIGGGLPVSVPALTVNRVCGSGAQAVVSAVQEILAGISQILVAGGMENMDRMLSRKGVVQTVCQHAIENLGGSHAISPTSPIHEA